MGLLHLKGLLEKDIKDMRRYHIVEGDKTTVDGIVQPHTGNGAKVTWHGKIKSYIGDKVLCKACNSMGVIQASGSRVSFSAHKLMPALNDDLCICKCNPPPKLINSQTVFYETISDEATVAMPLSENGSNSKNPKDYNIAVQFVNDEGMPYINMAYTARHKRTGQIHTGVTDKEGFTERFFSDSPDEYDVHLKLDWQEDFEDGE